MSASLTLIIGTAPAAAPLPTGYRIRPVVPDDTAALGRLYFAAYPPGVAGNSIEEATVDIAATFSGDYGQLWPEASPAVVAEDGELVAAVLTVRRAPWDDMPPGPFVIEIFTHPDRRRLGIGRAAVAHALGVALLAGPVGLRVDADNLPALHLYQSLGFREWVPSGIERDGPVTGSGKLVRDRIPEIIRANGETATTRIVTDGELMAALTIKLGEEVSEYASSGDVVELADLVEVVRALVAGHGLSWDAFEAIRTAKRTERGGFADGVFLIDSGPGNG